jgi:outer membrane immunogenic protein
VKKTFLFLLLAALSSAALADNQFAGPYLGASLGHVSGDDDGKEYDAGVFDDYTQNTGPSGGLFGVFAGYNWIMKNNVLLGIEGDYDVRNADDRDFQDFMGVPDTDYTAETDLKAAASIRGRLGYLFNGNRTVAYVTGGYATARIERTFTEVGVLSQSSTDWQDGWTAGIGIEHNFMKQLAVRAEYRHADYGDETVATDVVYGPTYTEDQDYDEDTFRISINYLF